MLYDIFMDTRVVGQAEVIKEGLYYRFSCKCTPPDGKIYKIAVSDGDNTKELGICVPTGEWFCLVRRVPVKYLPGEKLDFSLVPKNKEIAVVTVETDEPFDQLDRLDSSRLQESDGKTEILIDPAQDPPDNDQNRESPHIWEQP